MQYSHPHPHMQTAQVMTGVLFTGLILSFLLVYLRLTVVTFSKVVRIVPKPGPTQIHEHTHTPSHPHACTHARTYARTVRTQGATRQCLANFGWWVDCSAV